MCAVHSFYKLHAQLSKLMQNYECTFFVVTPFFTAARHRSVCVLLEGKQSASTASFLFLRDKVTNWLTGFLSLQKIHCLFWMRRINYVGKKKLAYGGMKQWVVLTECNLVQHIFHNFPCLSLCQFVTKEYTILLKAKENYPRLDLSSSCKFFPLGF